MFLRNVGVYLQVHMVSQPRRPTSTSYDSIWPFQAEFYFERLPFIICINIW
jgi:hypothetical protein